VSGSELRQRLAIAKDRQMLARVLDILRELGLS
jgi:hypothetical protein